MADMIGQVLGKYQIIEELGKGGFATVYRAVDTSLGREVALKVLDPLLARDEAWVARFHREARAVARLRHPYIVTIHEIGEGDGRLFIAMEMVEGPSLKELIAERGCLSWGETLRVLAQVAEALDYAHGQGILHRDLKPGNVLMDARQGPMLTDFGFARLVGESSVSVSGSGGIVGTPSYIAPEIWRDEAPCSQTDLYALGCVAYEMLTGAVLFAGKTPAAVVTKHLVNGPQFPEHWPEGVPAGVEDVLRRALAQEPGERYRSTRAMVAALRATVRPEPAPVSVRPEVPHAEVSAADVSPPKTSAGPRTLPGWAWGAVGGGGLMLAMLVCLGVVFWPQLLGALAAPTEVPTEVPTEAPTVAPTEVPTETVVPTPAPTKAPTISTPTVRIRPGDDQAMVYVSAGESQMGSTDADLDYVMKMCPEWGYDCTRSWFENEQPAHTVALDAYWIDETEVTNAQFAAFLNERGNQIEGGVTWLDVGGADCLIEQSGGEYRPKGEYADYPVIEVSWYGAAAYCEWVGGRLPTEAEWEYAARGPEGHVYPWGDDFECSRGNFDDETKLDDYVVPGGEGCDGYDGTAPVGSFPSGKSWVGALDMAGNVWEWVADWYATDYYDVSTSENPEGPSSGDYRVLRGGSWFYGPVDLRTAARGWYTPDATGNYLGFRCARSSY